MSSYTGTKNIALVMVSAKFGLTLVQNLVNREKYKCDLAIGIDLKRSQRN